MLGFGKLHGGGLLALACVFAPTYLACGESDGPKPVARTELAKVLSEAVCNNIGPCCRASAFQHDTELCRLNMQTSLQATMDNIMQSGKVHYDPAAAGRCVEAMKAAAISCAADDEVTEDNCRGVFAGVQPVGAACSRSSECAQPSKGRVYCNGDGVTGVCQLENGEFEPPHGKLGDSCNSTCFGDAEEEGDESCGLGSVQVPPPGDVLNTGGACHLRDNLECDAGTLRCTTVPKLGEACVNNCALGAFCAQGICKPQLSKGSCADSWSACAKGSTCDFETRECVVLRKAGEACSSSIQCRGGDCTDGVCRGGGFASEDMCSGDLD